MWSLVAILLVAVAVATLPKWYYMERFDNIGYGPTIGSCLLLVALVILLLHKPKEKLC